MEFSLIKNNVISGKKTFRTPFKVMCMSFSPQNDLIALGSKNGEVMMKRTTWKTIWKTNVGMVPAVGTICTAESAVAGLEYSPDGRFIAAATSKGLMHLLDVETGKVRFSVKVAADEKITKLGWFPLKPGYTEAEIEMAGEEKICRDKEEPLNLVTTKPDVSREEIAFVYQRLDEDGTSFKHDEAQRDALEKTFISSNTFNESLRNTIILACIDDMKISVLIAGVFPYMEIDVQSTISGYQQDLIMLYDMHYSNALEGVTFAVTTYGPFLDCQQQKLLPPRSAPKREGTGCHTLLFNVKLDLDTELWDAALRYIRLLYGFNLFSVSLDTTKQNWKEEMKELHNRFDPKTKAVKMGEVLIELLLSGATDPAGEAYLERGMGMDGLSAITHFVEKNMAEVSRMARGQLATSARNLAFQRCEFATAIERYELLNQLDSDDNYLYEEEVPAPEKNAWLTDLEEMVNILDLKTRQLGLQCLTMMQELGHLVKWMSLTKPFAKSMKVNSLIRMKRMDIAKVLEFIVSNFISDKKEAQNMLDALFNIKVMIKNQLEEDARTGFDEIEYIKGLEAKAEEERSQLEEKFHHKFDFAAYADVKQETNEVVEPEPEPMVPEEAVPAQAAAGVAESEQEQGQVNLDRVGSFFTHELDEKALEVLPACNEVFDGILEGRGKRMNKESIRKMGLMAVVSELAKLLSTPQKLRENKKPEVTFVYEIASGERHQGYLDVKVYDATPPYLEDHMFNHLIGMGRTVQVTAIEKKSLYSLVIVPKTDMCDYRRQAIKEHIEGMVRDYRFETFSLGQASRENVRPEERMEVDDELRVDVDIGMLPEYDTLVEYSHFFPLLHGELVILGKFSSPQPNTGIVPRIMKTTSSYPHDFDEQKDQFAVHVDAEGKIETSIDMMIVHQTTEMTAYLHDDGSKITIGDMKREVPMEVVPREFRTQRKTFRDYQRRREEYREEHGVGSLNDIQYDVLVQEAMDENRELGRNQQQEESF